MTDVVLVALISAGAAVVVALMTQFLTMKAADRQAGRLEGLEALRWKNNEASRAVERRRADLQALWAAVLESRYRLSDQLDNGSVQRGDRPLAESGAGAAARAYAVALVGLPDVREQAKAYYEAVARLEAAKVDSVALQCVEEWGKAYRALEEVFIKAAEQAPVSVQSPD
jgi:hypothetical protein